MSQRDTIENSKSDNRTIKRRQILQALSATAGLSALAGCQGFSGSSGNSGSGNSDNGSSNKGGNKLGERVPTVDFQFYGLGGVYEKLAPLVEKNIKNLGFNVNTNSGDFTAVINAAFNDARNYHLLLFGFSAKPQRLDPQEFTRTNAADFAGADGNPNYTNYANCKYTKAAVKQQFATPEKKRHDLVNKSQKIISDDMGVIPMLNYYAAGAGRKDQVNFKKLGKKQITYHNQQFQIYSETKSGKPMNLGTDLDQTSSLDWLTFNSTGATAQWNHIPNSALFEYLPNWELQPVLAKKYSVENNGKRIVINLRKGGTFHNGDPITADDVKFTLKHLEKYISRYPLATTQGYNSIKVIDNHTIEVNFKQPNPSFITIHMSTFGILSKNQWTSLGADKDPSKWPTKNASKFVGSGPFKVASIKPGQQVSFKPHDGHPYYPTPKQNQNFVSFQGPQPAANALIQGSIQAKWTLPSGTIRRLEDNLSKDKILTTVQNAFSPRLLQPQYSFGPSKFKAFRHAIGKGLNRQEMNTVAFDGTVKPWYAATLFGTSHPWRAPDDQLSFFTHKPQGDPEGAKEVLRNAGWGQDDQGNWHYPADADLSPRWPKGKQPSSSEFPCLNKNGEYKG